MSININNFENKNDDLKSSFADDEPNLSSVVRYL